MTDDTNPSALLVQVFQDSISSDRTSEWRSETAIDGIYSVAIPSQDTRGGQWFVTVTGVATHHVHYRIVVIPIAPELHVNRVTHGEVTSKDWVIHEVHGSASASDFRVQLTKFTGDFYIVVRQMEPPTIFSPPYKFMREDTAQMVVDVCDVDAQHVTYVPLGVPSRMSRCFAFRSSPPNRASTGRPLWRRAPSRLRHHHGSR